MRYNFKFEKILDLKIKLEDNKKMEISAINREITNINQNIEDINISMENMYLEFDRDMKLGMDVKYIKDFNEKIEFMKKKILLLNRELIFKRENLKTKQTEYIEIMKDKKAFEILKENDMQSFKKALNKKEEAFVDQLVSFQYSSAN